MNTALELLRDSLLSSLTYLAPRFANVVMFILIGRLAGPEKAGIFALATTYLLIFTAVLSGLDDLATRQVSRQGETPAELLGRFLPFRLVLSLILFGLLAVIVREFLGYPVTTSTPILILTFSLIPENLSMVIQAVLLGLRRFTPPALVISGTSVLKLAFGCWSVLNGGSLETIAWVWFAGSLLNLLVMLVVAIRECGNFLKLSQLDWNKMGNLGVSAWPFLMMTFLTTLEGQTDIILLSIIRNEAEVGWYNAATTIVFSLTTIAQAYRMSVYPVMARYAAQSSTKLTVLYHSSLRFLGMIILPMIAGIFILSRPIILLVFKDKFLPTTAVLQILIWVLLFLFLNVPTVRLLLVFDKQKAIASFLLITTLVNIGMNILFDPIWGARAAAFSRLISTSSLFTLIFIYVNRYHIRTNLFKILTRPVLATVIMSIVVWILREKALYLPIFAGAIIYPIALLLLGEFTIRDILRVRQAFYAGISALRERSVQ